MGQIIEQLFIAMFTFAVSGQAQGHRAAAGIESQGRVALVDDIVIQEISQIRLADTKIIEVAGVDMDIFRVEVQ